MSDLKDDETPRKRRSIEAASDYKLPDTISEPSEHLGAYTMMIFGEKKIGKTTLAAEFPKACFLFFEPGGRGLRVFSSLINDWTDAKAALKALKKDEKFQTIVVDTADLAYKLAESAACKRLGIDDPGDAAYGKGWRAVRKEFEAWLTGLGLCGKGLIIISHSSEQEVQAKDGSSYDRIMPTMAKQAREIVDGMVDIWAYYGYEGRRRVLQIEGDENVSCGHRLTERFRTADGERLRSIDMGKSPKDGYRNLVAAFQNEYVAPSVPMAVKKAKKR
jgi:hypothetical protein